MTPDELRAGLAATGWSHSAIAREIGRSRRMILRYLAGDVAIEGPVSIALRHVLGTPPAHPVQPHKVRSKVVKRRSRK